MEPKSVVRQRILKERDALSEEERGRRSRIIHDRLKTFLPFQEATVALFYASFRSEVETEGIIKAWLASGKVALLPVVIPAEKTLLISRISSLDDLCPGFRDIPEPQGEHLQPVDIEEVELAVVPGVAFDLQGHRLGYGGGYYDRLFGLLSPSPLKIGLAFELQILPELLASAHDIAVDAIVTEERIILPERSSRVARPFSR
ncbi:MAG: 5-formyltetrahydrofolate cyclo-ligase [candidate division NC10 bacterium]|nr:5-formyltetrahydrofolate cyclo-ligase [candidate division NC10 bacterium]